MCCFAEAAFGRRIRGAIISRDIRLVLFDRRILINYRLDLKLFRVLTRLLLKRLRSKGCRICP